MVAAAIQLIGCRRPADTSQADAGQASSNGAPEPTGSRPTAATASTQVGTTGAAESGSWQGRFAIHPGVVHLPRGVRYPTWHGAGAEPPAGNGRLRMHIDDDGYVVGTASGALGTLTLRGRVEKGELRAGLQPQASDSSPAMFGVLVGKAQGDCIEGLLRASSETGERVSEASVTMTRDSR